VESRYSHASFFVKLLLRGPCVCVNPDRAHDMNDQSTENNILEYMALGKSNVQFDLTEGRFSAGDASPVRTAQ
jgi:hypothetical protein